MLEWIHRNVDYVAGVSNAETTAERTFVDRAGVCRDFTHLGITFARALGIPARAVSAYALQLDPPDFRAIFDEQSTRAKPKKSHRSSPSARTPGLWRNVRQCAQPRSFGSGSRRQALPVG
jgi:transglutaminase superfamily protein